MILYFMSPLGRLHKWQLPWRPAAKTTILLLVARATVPTKGLDNANSSHTLDHFLNDIIYLCIFNSSNSRLKCCKRCHLNPSSDCERHSHKLSLSEQGTNAQQRLRGTVGSHWGWEKGWWHMTPYNTTEHISKYLFSIYHCYFLIRFRIQWLSPNGTVHVV